MTDNCQEIKGVSENNSEEKIILNVGMVEENGEIPSIEQDVLKKINLNVDQKSEHDINTEISLPIEDSEPGKFDDVTKKIIHGVYSIGSSLYSAGSRIIKQGFLEEFTKEQNNFVTNRNVFLATDLPPWEGHENEKALKEQCLNLSSEYSNFLRNPPVGSDFKFNYNICYPKAKAMMKHDPRLEKVRFNLVPKQVPEEHFWRNYFYRIELLVQANNSKEFLEKKHGEETGDSSRKNDSWSSELEFEEYELINESIS